MTNDAPDGRWRKMLCDIERALCCAEAGHDQIRCEIERRLPSLELLSEGGARRFHERRGDEAFYDLVELLSSYVCSCCATEKGRALRDRLVRLLAKEG
jgi:hypothetical protein